MNHRIALPALALVGLVLGACGSDETSDDTPGAGDTPTPAQLDGRAFVSTGIDGHELVDDTTITLGFEADTMSARGGCNTLNGGFSIDEDVLTAIGPFAMTMMACDDALMEQDMWLSEFLSDLPRITLDANTLRLTGGDTTITFLDTSEANPDVDLEGTTWVVTSTVANEAISSVPADSTASLTITDGTAAVNTGCNTGSGTVEVTDTTLSFGPLAITERACRPDLSALETSVLAVLSGDVTYEISGDTLSLRSGSGADEVGLDLAAR